MKSLLTINNNVDEKNLKKVSAELKSLFESGFENRVSNKNMSKALDLLGKTVSGGHHSITNCNFSYVHPKSDEDKSSLMEI